MVSCLGGPEANLASRLVAGSLIFLLLTVNAGHSFWQSPSTLVIVSRGVGNCGTPSGFTPVHLSPLI